MRICTSGLFLLALLAAGPAVAAEKFDPAARAKIVAPFIDEQTVLIARVVVSRLEVDALFDKAAELIRDLVPEERTELDRVREEEKRAILKKLQAAFCQAGGKEVYLLFSVADVDFHSNPVPFLIVPLGEKADEKALVALFRQTGLDVQQRLGDVLFVGSRATLSRLKALSPVQRPEIAAAFEAAGDTAAQAVLLPPKYAARVIEEMLPDLPKEIGGGPSTAITQGLLWAVVAADLPPKMSLRLAIQSRDAEAAGAFREKWIAAVELLGQQKEVRKMVPMFDKLAALLTPQVQGDRLSITLDEHNRGFIALLAAAVKPAIQAAREQAKRAQSAKNLKQIGLAMHNWHNLHKAFPAVASYDADGKPLLSWRVHILPYVGGQGLYKEFHLDEPWGSQYNRKLIEQIPAIYRCPASKLKEKGRTSYVVAVGEETVFPGCEGIPIKEIKDGPSRTIMAVEVDDEHAVIWTKPQDLPFDPENPAKGLGGVLQGGFNALFCDGSVRFIADTVDPKVLRALFTRAGAEPVPLP